jgi:hypothetical protein
MSGLLKIAAATFRLHQSSKVIAWLLVYASFAVDGCGDTRDLTSKRLRNWEKVLRVTKQ